MSDYGNPPPTGGQPPSGAQPPGGGYPPPPPLGPGDRGSQAKGFFGALFDFSFESFITPMIVKFVYVIATIALGLLYVFAVISSLSQSAGLGLVVLLLGAVGFVLYLAFIRMTLEFYLAIVRMSQDINQRLPRA